MPPGAIKNQLERLIEELSEASSTLEVIQRHYHEAKDWPRYGMYLQFQHKIGEVIVGLDKQRNTHTDLDYLKAANRASQG
jgi:hypothetical protein